MNKKVGIYSLHGYTNYGNKLQNYAVERLVDEMGYEPVSLIIRAHPLRGLIRDQLLVKRFKLTSDSAVRTARFLSFDEKYLHNKRPILNRTLADMGADEEFAYFVAGSDQVWYCEDVPFTPEKMSFYAKRFLAFAPEGKRIALSPSFGMDELPPQWRDFYAKYLSKFKALSLREESGARLVKVISGIDAPILPDPTIAFESDFWSTFANDSILANAGSLDEPYIFAFFLGEPSGESLKLVKSLSKSLDCRVLGSIGDTSFLSASGPVEFVDIVRRSRYVVTDSFHCAVFSLVFHRDLAVSRRAGEPGMFSRIETLLNGTGLEGRVVGTPRFCSAPVDDWDKVDSILEGRSRRLKSYLSEAMGAPADGGAV